MSSGINTSSTRASIGRTATRFSATTWTTRRALSRQNRQRQTSADARSTGTTTLNPTGLTQGTEALSITLMVTATDPIILTSAMPRMDPITVAQKQAVTAVVGTVVTVVGMEAAMAVLVETGVAVAMGVAVATEVVAVAVADV